VKIRHLFADMLANSGDEVRLDLASALAADAVLVADLLQGERLVGHQSLLEDEALFIPQILGKLVELVPQEPLELLVAQPTIRRRPLRRQETIRPRRASVFADRGVERKFVVPQSLIHLDNVLLCDVEAIGQKLGGNLEALGHQAILLLAQLEEEL